jgi:putative N-acetyltransferase (TIGR04045 family)
MGTVSSSPLATSATCRLASGPDELAAHYAVRRRVFVEDQSLFDGSDEDARDRMPGTLHVVGLSDGEVVGAVRLYPLDDAGLWKGDRLAVLPDARVRRLGALLVRFAVSTAGERGGHTMVAQIQLPNVRFFEHLGWSADGPPAPYHGVMHQPMAIPLVPTP